MANPDRGGKGKSYAAGYLERYPDFGPTLAAEKLQQEGMRVDHETLRRWLMEKGLWSSGRKEQQHRSWRERRECFGQMVQLDGSQHDWFEGRRDKAVLMVMVDDATNRTGARFSEAETTRASYDVFDVWIKKNGVPGSLTWIGTASIAASAPPRWVNKSQARSRGRSLAGPWNS